MGRKNGKITFQKPTKKNQVFINQTVRKNTINKYHQNHISKSGLVYQFITISI